MSPKLLYLGLRAIGRASRTDAEPGRARPALGLMPDPIAPPLRHAPKIQLMLRTREGRGWELSLSEGMERFIGHYPRVAGLGSGGPLLCYEPVGHRRDG